MRDPDPLAEFHQLARHPGPADGCQACAQADVASRQAATRARAGRRARERAVDRLLEVL
ncbi:MAG TPA: hypothetical protein VG276_28855 [Actinomycetes bacterium]|jgi:hypothetical protein|nr:hypothetical protein [Actinomycetes bacterium]